MSQQKAETPLLRGVPLHPLADFGLPLLLLLQTAIALSVFTAAIAALLGAPLLPGLGFWAFLVGLESFLFTGYFFVRELDMPRLLRWVEAVLVLLVSKLLVTLPSTGFNLAALIDLSTIEVWVGLTLLLVAWWFGMQTAEQAGALHPGLMPDLSLEGIGFNPHGEALDGIRRRVIITAAWTAVLIGILPTLSAMGEGNGTFLISSAVKLAPVASVSLAALSLAVAARLKKEIDWALERLQPPTGVLGRWLPQAIALILLPLILALLLPAGPRLPVERWLPLNETQREWVQVELPATSEPGDLQFPFQEWLEQAAPAAVQIPPWVRLLLKGIAWLLLVALLLKVMSVAWRQLADRMGGGGGLAPLIRTLLRWYASLWQALWAGVRGGVELAGRGVAEVAARVVGEARGLGKGLPIWRRAPAEPRAAVRYYYARLEQQAQQRGLPRTKELTAKEFGVRLAEALPEQQPEIQELIGTYEEARYGPDLVSGEQVSRVRGIWRLVGKALGRR